MSAREENVRTLAADAKCVHFESNSIQFVQILLGILALSPAIHKITAAQLQ
jgi:hypothetical protein